MLSFHRATSARIDNRAVDISQIFDVPLEAAHAHIFSVISPEKSRSLCNRYSKYYVQFIPNDCIHDGNESKAKQL